LQSFFVDGSDEVASVALTVSLADVATVNLSIPAGWNTWKCEAWASYVSSGTGDFNVVIRIDGTDSQTKAPTAPSDGAVGGRRTGITTTGSRAISLRANEGVSNVSLQDIFLYASAYRTS
jgi:hypothetical protein